MAYDRVNWEDAPSTKTPISAENLNKMDAGILANDKKLRKAISIKQEVDDSAENIDSTFIESLPAATAAEDTDIMILENATKTQKITWGTILNLIKTKLGIGTAANLQTTSKEIVGAVNELNSNLLKVGSIYGAITVEANVKKFVSIDDFTNIGIDSGRIIAVIPMLVIASSGNNVNNILVGASASSQREIQLISSTAQTLYVRVFYFYK